MTTTRGPARPLSDVSSASPRTKASSELAEIRSLIKRHAITMAYQPIVHLPTGTVVAYEALARGPAGTPLESPAVLFPAAFRAGLGAELDLLCRAQAVSIAAQSPDREKFVLFVNGEPAYLPTEGGLVPFLDQGAAQGRTVLEIAERSVFARPADLLRAVAAARQSGWAIAVDDVGKSTDSLGLLPLVDPDVIKLDLWIIQGRPGRRSGLTFNAVMHHVEESGCLVLAEGIETEAHLERARALGATLGQGWYFGRPEPLSTATATATAYGPWPRAWPQERPEANRSSVAVAHRPSPFSLVATHPQVRQATKEVLYALSLDIEQQAASQPDGAVVFGCFQREEHLTPATRNRWERLAEHSSLVAVFGNRIEPEPARRVRGASIEIDDPMVEEWNVVVLSSHFAAALLSSDLGDAGPDNLRRFDYLITYERSLVIAIARLLANRVLPIA